MAGTQTTARDRHELAGDAVLGKVETGFAQ